MNMIHAGCVARYMGPENPLLCSSKDYTVGRVDSQGRVRIVGEYDNGGRPVGGVSAHHFQVVRTAEQEAARKKHAAFVTACERDRIPARKTDPSTSQLAAVKPKRSLRGRMLEYVSDAQRAGTHHNGWTGHEFAQAMDAPLNSVTPRLAELRKVGAIKDSGLRRYGQIVWVAV